MTTAAAPASRRAPLPADHTSEALRLATPQQRAVLASPHYDIDQLQGALQQDITAHEVRRLRARGVLLGVRCGRHGYLYPQFQVEASRRRFNPVVVRINRTLSGRLDPGAAMAWWFDVCPRTGLVRTDMLHSPDDLADDAVAALADTR